VTDDYFKQINKFTAVPVDNTDDGHERIIQNFVLLAPEARVAAMNDYDSYLEPDPSPSKFAEHFALNRKLKSVHASLKRINR
jgi:hypothetical protein